MGTALLKTTEEHWLISEENLSYCFYWLILIGNYKNRSLILLSLSLCSMQKWQRPRSYAEDSKYLTTTVINIAKPLLSPFSPLPYATCWCQHPLLLLYKLLFSSKAQGYTAVCYLYHILLKLGKSTRKGQMKLTVGETLDLFQPCRISSELPLASAEHPL